MKIKINKKDLYLLLAFLGGFLYLVQNAWAVQVNRVQSGTAYLDADDTLVTADLTYPVTDQSKCIILLYPRETRLTTDRDQNHLYTAIFEDNGTIMIERAGATQVAYVSWYVIEFEDGVKVVRGITSMKDTTTTKNIDLPQQFDLNKSFIILQLRAPYANPTYTENLFGTAHFIDNDTIQINRGCRSVNTAQTYVYQVVEFSNDANVRTGEVTIAYNATTATASLNPAIADINKAFLITLFRGNNNALDGTEAHIMVRGTITNNTTLTFTREGTSTSTSDTVTVRWFLVELTDSLSRVQKNAPGTPATFSTGTVNVPETINITLNPSVDPTRSFPILRVSGGTGTGTSGGTTYDDFFDDNCVAAELSSTTLSLKRYALATEPGSTTADYASKVDWFVVELAPITVKTPNGGETLVVNEPYEITWRNAASVSNVKIEYSDDNGSTWKTIVNSVPAADKSYTWTVGYDSGGSPILPAYEKETDCLIRISDASNSNLYDVSNGNFTIKSKLKIISPNGGELWYVGDTNRNITWDKWGNFDGTVKLQYSVDAEHNTWTDISGATDLPVNQGSFNWNPLPLEASGKTVKVRIVSNTYPNDVFDTSDNDFEIRGNITVNKPNASSEWPTGYPNDIEWTLNSNTTSVDIYYSLDNGQTYNLIVQGTNAKNVDDTHGKYSWTPPLDKASNFSKIKVVDHSDADVFGISETFKIIPSIKVISPNGGEIWKVDQSKKIEWEVYPATGIQYVTIKYCTDFTTNKTWQVVQGGAQVDASLGEFSWTVPDAITIGATAGIRIEKYLDANIYDESDGPFQIKGDITVIQPQAGIKIPAHQNFVISWTPHGSLSEKYGNNFRIAYSNNGGVSYTTIYTGINASLGEKVWYSTDIPLDNLGQPDSRIKIGLIGDDEPPNGVYGESESFSIRGNITVTYPNGGEIFNIGDHCVIKWDAYPSGYGALGTVRIAYSKNSGNDGYPDSQVIVTGIDASSGTTGYDWQIPDADLLYNTIRIQVRLAVDPTGEVKDESDYDFTIKGNLDLTRPSENPNDPALTWLCGTQEAITWIRNGSSMGAVDIYFSRNNGEDNYIGVIDASGTIPSGNQSYIWTIPSLYDPEHPEKWPFKTGDNGINLQIRIKLVSHDDPSGVYSISQQPLTIKSRFIDLVPNGGIITVGEPFNITWTTQGEVGTVNIKYSTDGGNTFSGIIVLGVTNAEGYYWNPVNCPVDNDIRIRVESAVYPNDIYLVSQNNIDAKGKIEITSPSADNRGENGLIPTETHRITWITNGGVGSDIGVVDLYYAQDGVNFGTPFAQVDTAVQNYYDWTVPSPTSLPVSTAKIKIVDNSDSSVFDISDAFDIRGKFWNGTTNHALIEPNGGEVYYVGGTIRIKWKYKGNIGQSELYYDTNEGNNGYPNFIATVNHNQNESEGVCYYDWPVPETAGTKYRVKLKAVSDAYCYANSLGNFVIKGNLNLTSPGRNPENPEVWYVDQTNPISWTMQGGISQVDLLLDTDGDLDFDDFVIASGIGGGSSPYQWTISQENDRVAVTSDNCRVRVRDHNDPTVYSSSTNSFYIKPKVFIGEIVGSPWTVEEQKTITWTKTGKVSQLNLYYSSQGQDGPWNLQISGINAEAGSVLWTIPQTAVSWGNAVLKLVRVEGGQEDNYVISKSQNFSIKGKINVTYPTTAQTYNVLQTGQIQWYVVGAVGNVDIKYNTNYQNNYPDEDWANFPGATNIPPDYCSNPEHPYYVFNIPSETAPYVKIRVVESQHPEVFGPPMAGSPTHKFKGSIFFDQPPGNPSTRNQTIVIGPTPHTIHWSLVGTFSGLRAYYKKIGDSSWTQIGSDLPGTATQTNYTPIDSDITLPDGSNKVLFRVEDIADPQNVYAETPVNEGNTVKGYLEILEPITPQEFTVGSTTQVKWKKYGNIGNLKFELWDGTQWLNNAGGSNLPDSYPCGQSGEGGVVLVPAWTVPDKIGTGRKIRVTSLTYPELTSTTGEFTIKGSFKSIVTPQVWYVGEDHLIEWEANGSMASVKIELYNGVSWATIEANYNNNGQGLNNGYNSYLWSASSPLQQQRSSNCKIRITSNQNPDVYIETGNFTIKPKIVVDTPTQPWIAETNNNQISWQTIPPPTTNVDIILIDNNNGQGYPVTLASNIPKNSSPYVSSVTLPATLTNSAKIRVRDSSFPDFVYGDSGTFKIIGAIIMDPVDNTPNANSNWEVESVQNITWSHKGNLGQVNIRYRYDGGNYSSPINSTPIDVTAHSYAWQIPMIISENVQVKIESVNNPTEEYVESPIFKIKGKFILNEPGTLICGEPYNIQWTQPEAQKDLITDVILEFYNGTEWSYVNPTSPYTVPNTGSYAWTVPTNTRGTTCRIRISDPDNPGAKDETENFAVLPTLNVTSPTSTTKWTIGTTGNFINFTVTGPVNAVKIDYSKDNGDSYTYTIVSNYTINHQSGTGNYSYNWTIPTDKDILTEHIEGQEKKARIKVADTSLSTIYGLSGLFMVKSTITVNKPSAADILKVGEAFNIEWSTPCSGEADMGNVKIQFSKTGSAPWTDVATVRFDASPYTGWAPPPDGITDNQKTAKIRIIQLNNTEVYDDSDGFEIEGKLILNEPIESGLKWAVGSTDKVISWTPIGIFSPIKIEYSKDNFQSDIHLIASGVANSNHNTRKDWTWTSGVPDDISDTVKIRVSYENDPDVYVITPNPIKFIGSLQITYPNSQEPKPIWYKGESKTITWNAVGTITNVKIEYKTSATGSYTTIVANDPNHTAGANSYVWSSVADENSEDCYIRISDVYHPEDVVTVSQYPFSIRPVITVTKPEQGADLKVGSNNNEIRWNLGGSTKVQYVKLYYSKDGGPFNNVIDDSGQVDAQGGLYYWNNIPDAISSDIKVRVVDAGNPNVYGTSGSFNIIGQFTAILQPNASSNWEVGTQKTISWTYKGSMGTCNIYYDYGQGYGDPIAVGVPVGEGGSGSWIWTSIPDTVSNNVKIKIASVNNPDKEYRESETFKIRGGFSNLKFANDETVLTSGEEYTIVWTRNGTNIPNVVLEFSSDNGQTWSYINPVPPYTVPNTGSYSWTAPSSGIPEVATSCKIRITDPNNSEATTQSGVFEIRAKITVTRPTSTDEWTQGTTENINWNITGVVNNVKIEYSKDNGANWVTVISSRPAQDKPYSWEIPLDVDLRTPNQAKIRISQVGNSPVYGLSSNFRMKGVITVNRPNASDVLKVGEPFNITWTTGGFSSGNVIIGYSTTGGAPFTVIDTVAYNYGNPPGTYPWTPPVDAITANQKKAVIEIKDALDPTKTRDESDLFEIEGKIELIQPNTSGIVWAVNSTQEVKWRPWGNYAYVEIHYSKDNFVADEHFLKTVANVESGTVGTTQITVPDDISKTVRVRVRDKDDPDVKAISNYNINVVGSLDVTSPEQEGIVWYVGETNKVISWNAVGTITNVKIEYKTSATGAYTTIVANDPGHTSGGNSYIWTQPVPDENSEDCYIRVSDVNNYDLVYSESTIPFSIRPVITVTKPGLDENIEVGSTGNQIRFTINSSKVTKVDIYYSTNGLAGPFDKLITPGFVTTQGENIFSNWGPVLDTISGNCVIRVRDKTNDIVNDKVVGYSAVFDIIGKITISEPHQGENVPAGSSKTIVWTRQGTLGNLKIYYYHDGSYDYITTVDSGQVSSYDWNPVPPQIENNTTIKIVQEATEGQGEDEVKAISQPFNIVGNFTLTEPPGTLNSGSSYQIQWENYDLGSEIPNAKLEYFTGSVWRNIDYVDENNPGTGIVPNTESYYWTVPTDVRYSACKFRISDPNNSSVYDESNTFEIRPTLNVTSPTSTTKWTIGTTGNFINFTVTGPVNAVKIDYSKDNGDSYTYTIVSNYTINHQSGTGNYSYNWTIPTDKDILTEHIEGQEKKARIKVADTSLSTIYGLSGLFMVKSTITVNKPSAADILKVGEAFNIEWSTPCSGEADMGNVKIQFSKTGSAPWTDVATVRFDASPYTGWAPPPDGITDNQKTAKIRIIQLNNTEVYDDSDGFEIEGKIRLDSPDLDEPVWYVSDTQQIKWTPTGNFSYVRIEYSKDGGETWVYPPIANSYSNPPHGQQGSYDWTIPDSIGNNLRVKITALNDPDVKAISSRPFTIKGKLTLIAPNGRDIWYVNETNRKVRWQATGSIETVRIELSKNNGGTWIELISNAPAGPGAGEYTLLSVPDAISDQCLIRISDTKDPEVKDVSDEVFSIKGRLYVEKPDGSERWIVNSSGHEIRWSMDGSIQNVKITYSADGGPFNNVIVSSTPASNYSYTWNNLPTHVGKYRIKIADVNDEENVYAISNEFKIVGQISVVKPAGGEKLRVGSDFKIEWAKIGDFANVRIEYSTNGGQTYDYQIVESTPADNLYYWWTNISSSTVSPNVVLKITDASDIQTYAVSNPFKIQGIFNITSPDGGEVWQVDSDQTITWTTVGNISKVNLYYSTNGGDTWELIAQEIPNTGSKSWKVPDAISNYCRVKVVDSNDMESWDTSAGNFKICGALRITSPNTGTESWLVGTEQSITWEVTGSISRIKLEYSVDGGSYEGIPGADNLPAQDKSFNWTIPDRLSSQVRVKITNKDDTTVFDTSDYPFTITGKLIVTSPTSADTWYVQEQRTISWQKIGTIPTVNLQYSIGGGEYQNIEDGQGVSGNSFNWIVPDAISTQVKIRVVNADSSKPTIPGVSDLFTIKGKLLITNPQLSDIWEVGKQKDITWTRIGSIGTVKLEYDYGNGFILIPGAGNIDSSLLKFTWTIPNTISNNVVVKITPNIETEAEPNTSPSFKIAADIELTSPVGGEIWIVDEERPITWDKTGDIDSIVLKYDINEGLGGYPYTIATRPASDRSYTWTVPDKIGDKVRVRIEDANVNSSTLPDESGNFTIRGAIGITQPRGIGPNKKVWLCETQENIAFTIHGSIANVQIRYSIDGGGSYPDSRIIVNSFPVGEVPPGGKNLTYTWTIPYETTTRAKIKIINLADSNVFDESDEFVIRGGFVFIHPTSGERWLAMSSKTIEWDTLGIINYVYIQYSLNDGVNWFFVNDGSPIQNLERYNWTVPEQVTNQARIKIVDTNDPDAKQISERFVIHGALTIIKPNGQEKFKVGQSDSSTKIVWSRVGTISAVDLALSANGQNGDYVTFATNVPASNLEYPWSVPTNVVSNNCFIRIRDSNDPLVEDYSDLAFKIMENITVTRPNGTERFVVDEQEEVKWETTSFPNQTNFVIIKYSTEPPYTNWITVASKTENDGSYLWTVPPTISNTCRIRISSYDDDADAYDISDGDFKIQGKITITQPIGGEKWGCATQQLIKWNWKGNISKVDIDYYNGSNWVAIDGAQNYNNIGEYEWTIPNIATEQARVRVKDHNDPTNVYDTSSPFKIMPRVVVQVPNGAEVWYAGSNATILWAKYGPASFDTVKIDYSVDDPEFNNPHSITTSTPNDGSFDWLNIPAEAVSGKVRIRVAHPSDPDVFDISDNDFRIRAQFNISVPNGGQKWTVGNKYNIVWSQIGNTQGVKFTYYRQTNPAINQTFTLTSNYGTGTYSYEWTVPDFIYNDLLMKIQDPNDVDAYDISDATFKIMPGFTVISPDAINDPEGSKWYVGDPATIRWDYTGTVGDVGIYYSVAGGIEGSWIPLTSVPAQNKSWTWPSVPDQITAQLKIKVASANDPDAYGVSNGMSKIRAKFSLSAPSGGEELIVGNTFRILWSNTGTVNKVDLHYSKDNFQTSVPIENGINIDNTGQFDWTIPDDISHTVKVRVKSHTDDDAYAISGAFRIKGNIWVKQPSRDVSWEIGKSYNISWGWIGTIPEVKITYSVNGLDGPFKPIKENYGTPDDGIVGNGSGSGGSNSEYSYSWTIPDEATGNALIRITDARESENDIVATSEEFNLVGYILVKTPSLPGIRMAVASNYTIRWEWGGTMPKVKITYSTNGDTGPFVPIQENYETPNDGIVANGTGSGGPGSEYSYVWTVPDSISTNCKIKIADARPDLEDTVFDVSDNTFKIQGAFTLITPALELNDNGTPNNPDDDFYECRWVTNEVRTISWDTFGTISKVDLTYAKDFDKDGDIDDADFANEIPMVNGTNIDNVGYFNWTVPNERLPDPPYYVNVKIRVYDHNDHEVYVEGPTPVGGVDTLKIDYYKITWDIRDLITNQPIAGLRVYDTAGDGWSDWTAQGLVSPVSHWVPAGYRRAEWTHKDYGPISEEYLVGWDPDARVWRKDRTIYRTMETLVVHIWRAYSEFAYDVERDKLDITSWLERDGSMVPGALIIDVNIFDGATRIKRKTILVDDVNKKHYYYEDIPSSVKLWIGDRLGEVRTMEDLFRDCQPYKIDEKDIPPDFAGFFQQSWSPTRYTKEGEEYQTLVPGRVYAVTTYMGLGTGAVFTTPVSFTVTIPSKMASMEQAVKDMKETVTSTMDKPISEMSMELQTVIKEKLDAQTTIIENKMTEQTQLIQSATEEMKETIREAMVSFENSVSESITLLRSSAEVAEEAAGLLETTALRYSWNAVVYPDPALVGDKITLTVQGPSTVEIGGKTIRPMPVLDIYNWENKKIIDSVVLIQTAPGVYTYQFEADSRFAPGKAYSYVVSDQVTGGMVAGSGMVESVGITTVAGLAAAAPEAERAAKKALDAIKAVEAVVVSGENINIALTLKNLKESVDALPQIVAKEGPSAVITQTINDIAERIKRLAGEEGYDLRELIGEALGESPTIKDVRSKTDAISSIVDLLLQLFEAKFGGVDSPIVSTYIQPGSIVFRIVAVNPSKFKTQKIPVKSYLPPEVKPEDVIDTGGLNLEYDIDQKLWYVYKDDLELAPGEMRVFNVEVKDVWIIPLDKINELRQRTEQILDKLKETDYYNSAKEIADSINTRLDRIITSQSDESLSRQQHIGIYRQNLTVLEEIKEDLARLERIVVTAGGPPAPEMLAKTKIKAEEPTKTMTWMVIFLIMIFTGLLAGVFFFTWHRQAKISKEEIISAKKSAFPETTSEEKPPEEEKGGS